MQRQDSLDACSRLHHAGIFQAKKTTSTSAQGLSTGALQSSSPASAVARRSSLAGRNLRLRDVDGLARHQAAVEHKQQRNRVQFVGGAGKPGAQRQVVEDPILADPVGHERVEAQARGDGRALKVGRLAGLVLGNDGGRHVEAGETGEAAEDEEGEQNVVDGGADTDREGNGGGGDTKGDEVGEGIELLAHHAALLAPAGDLAVHGVEEEAERQEGEGKPEVIAGCRVNAVPQRGEDGEDAAGA